MFLLISAAGCTQTVVVKPSLPPPPSEAFTIPLKVGLYLDPVFREYVYVERNYRLPLGEPLSKVLRTYLATLFAKVEEVPDLTFWTLREGGYQAVIRPEIRATFYRPSFRRRVTPMRPAGKVLIVSRWTLSDPRGRPIWAREITGEAKGDPRTASRLRKAVEEAVFDMLLKVGGAILRSREIADYTRSVRTSGVR